MDHIPFQQLLDLHKVGFLKVDNDEIIVAVNDKFCELIQYKRSFLIGKTFTDLLVRKTDNLVIDADVKRRFLGLLTTSELLF
jgi:PAS domain S-box-containing protein